MTNFDEGLAPGFNLLPSYQQKFLKGVHKEIGDASELQPMVPLLLEPNKIPERVQQELNLLAPYAVTPETAQNPRVREGLTIVQNFARNNAEAFARLGGVMYVWGSLRYDDPVHLDFDLVFATDRQNPTAEALTHTWTDQLRKIWPSKAIEDGYITSTSLEAIESIGRNIKEGTIDAYESATFDLSEFVPVISGYPIDFSPNGANHKAQQEKAWKLIGENPFIGAYTDVILQFYRRDREERRK